MCVCSCKDRSRRRLSPTSSTRGSPAAQIQGAVRRTGAVTLRLQLNKGEESVAECELTDVGPIVDTDRLQTFELSNAPAEFLEALAKAREEQR